MGFLDPTRLLNGVVDEVTVYKPRAHRGGDCEHLRRR
jgi:hypothetical protein